MLLKRKHNRLKDCRDTVPCRQCEALQHDVFPTMRAWILLRVVAEGPALRMASTISARELAAADGNGEWGVESGIV